MQAINTIYFSTRIGEVRNQVSFPVAPSLVFFEILPEIATKFGMESQNLAIATIGGNTLTPTDLINTVEVVVKKYGNQFEFINRGPTVTKPLSSEKIELLERANAPPKPSVNQMVEPIPRHRATNFPNYNNIIRDLLNFVPETLLPPYDFIINKVKKIGEFLNQEGGYELMQYVCQGVYSVNSHKGRTVESMWDGIGSWQG